MEIKKIKKKKFKKKKIPFFFISSFFFFCKDAMSEINLKRKKGRFVRAGGYGCVFTNEASLCIPDDEEHYLLKINKLPYKADEEWEMAEILSKIDPKQKYFLYPNYQCILTAGEIKKLNYYSSQCSFLNSEPDDASLRVLYIPHGGWTVEYYFFEVEEGADKTWKFAKKNIFHPIAKGLGILYKSGYIHHDIKGDNVVYDSDSGKCRMIDFGLMMLKDHYFTGVYEIMLEIGRGQSWNPPENRFVYDIDMIFNKIVSPSKLEKENLPEFFSKLYEQEFEKLNYKVSHKNKNSVIEMLFAYVFPREEYIELYTNAILDFIDTFYNTKYGTVYSDKLVKYADRVDVYGVGILMLELYDIIEEKNEAQYKKILRDCLHPNIQKRTSLKQLISMLEG